MMGKRYKRKIIMATFATLLHFIIPLPGLPFPMFRTTVLCSKKQSPYGLCIKSKLA